MSVNPLAILSGATKGASLGSTIFPGIGTAIGAGLGAAGGAMEQQPGGGPVIGGQSGTPPTGSSGVEAFAPGSFGPSSGALQPQFGGSVSGLPPNMNSMVREYMLNQLKR